MVTVICTPVWDWTTRWKFHKKPIRKAYHMKALACHPDKRQGDSNAATEFLQLKKAFDILDVLHMTVYMDCKSTKRTYLQAPRIHCQPHHKPQNHRLQGKLHKQIPLQVGTSLALFCFCRFSEVAVFGLVLGSMGSSQYKTQAKRSYANWSSSNNSSMTSKEVFYMYVFKGW